MLVPRARQDPQEVENKHVIQMSMADTEIHEVLVCPGRVMMVEVITEKSMLIGTSSAPQDHSEQVEFRCALDEVRWSLTERVASWEETEPRHTEAP